MVFDLQAVLETGNKQAAQKLQPLLPSIAKAANNPAPDIREAALNVLVAFCLKAGATLPAKVQLRSIWRHLQTISIIFYERNLHHDL